MWSLLLNKWVSGRVILFCRKCFRWELKMYFYNVILKFWPYLNIGCRGILELKKKKKFGPNRENPLNSNIDIWLFSLIRYYMICFQIPFSATKMEWRKTRNSNLPIPDSYYLNWKHRDSATTNMHCLYILLARIWSCNCHKRKFSMNR